LFAGMEEGTLQVKLIPRDARQCRLLVRNKSAEAVNVVLPETLAAVPVLAQQFADNPGRAGSAPQRLGLGNPFAPGGLNQNGPAALNIPGGQGRRGPLGDRNRNPGLMPFSIAPEKVAQWKLPAVCLDRGHPNPRPAMSYRIARLEDVCDKPELEQVCRRLGRGQISQPVAQAAAWHVSNEIGWQELRAMSVRKLVGPPRRLFSPRQVDDAEAMLAEIRGQLERCRGRDTLRSEQLGVN